MLTVHERGLLQNIIKHCEKIETKMSITDREKFNGDEDLREIICFNLFQIGELAKNFSSEFIKEYSSSPWKQIKGMRDKIGHGYGTIDLDKVWSTAQDDIKPLHEYCKMILDKNPISEKSQKEAKRG